MRKSTGSLLRRQQHRRRLLRARPEPAHRLVAPVATTQVDVTRSCKGPAASTPCPALPRAATSQPSSSRFRARPASLLAGPASELAPGVAFARTVLPGIRQVARFVRAQALVSGGSQTDVVNMVAGRPSISC